MKMKLNEPGRQRSRQKTKLANIYSDLFLAGLKGEIIYLNGDLTSADFFLLLFDAKSTADIISGQWSEWGGGKEEGGNKSEYALAGRGRHGCSMKYVLIHTSRAVFMHVYHFAKRDP